jgi:peroxiredoxin family protein/rhodanese-related sulfurtransferase
MDNFKRISAEQFAKLDFNSVTLVDLREPDELIVSSIEGAINIPFSSVANKLDTIPKDKPVYVYCRVGDWSEEIAEILADRGYDVTNLEGGYNAYKEYIKGTSKPIEEEKPVKAKSKSPEFIDAKGLMCPGPIVKVGDFLRSKPDGTKVYVEATEDAFASDIQVTKSVKKQAKSAPVQEQNDKTFVVFSGDLDKTIASFIMANGMASMGRKVTMFFTFWGLNILRKPEKVKVKKTFIEKMFGIMMPRGTKKLGLSRMNMGGAGAKMIRGIMNKKGISSLEELIDSAISHGVRIVACQMSMEIMGIHQEELIDGVELGGVATFIGSGEKSDMSLFI